MKKGQIYFIFNLLLLVELTILPSCHYQFGHGQLANQYKTLSIPYAEGDLDGHLTAEIIKKTCLSGAFKYVQNEGNLELKVKVLSVKNQNIGYRYDRKRSGKLKNSLIPSESRYIAIAEVTLIDTCKNRIIRGPTQITAKLDFDYDYYKIPHEANVFSLGQVSDVDSARDAARHPLNSQLADLIVDYLVNSW